MQERQKQRCWSAYLRKTRVLVRLLKTLLYLKRAGKATAYTCLIEISMKQSVKQIDRKHYFWSGNQTISGQVSNSNSGSNAYRPCGEAIWIVEVNPTKYRNTDYFLTNTSNLWAYYAKMFARLFTATALHRFMDTTKCHNISRWNLISIRGLVFQLPPSLAAPSDPPSAGPPSPETNHGKGNAFNDHPSWKTNPARPPHAPTQRNAGTWKKVPWQRWFRCARASPAATPSSCRGDKSRGQRQRWHRAIG